MSTESTPTPSAARLERTFDAPPQLISELLTTPFGLEQWWGPDGFSTEVSTLELRPGGQVRYTMTATDPQQIAFVQSLGLPLSSVFPGRQCRRRSVRRSACNRTPPSRRSPCRLLPQ